LGVREVAVLSNRIRAGLAVAGLAVSALALGLAPLLMPPSYSWVAHTTSESAAQGVPGAWLARGAFLLFGTGVVMIAVLARDRWGRWGAGLHLAFGLSMIAAGVFSARPWDARLPFSQLEDLLHSVAATAMGFAFAIGVALVALERWKHTRAWRLTDLAAVIASVALPLAMVGVVGLAGVLQRTMFLVAYTWYGIEAARGWGELDSDASERSRPAPSR
jgi:hypothetical protein